MSFAPRKYKPHRSTVKGLKFKRVYRCEGCGATYPAKQTQCLHKHCNSITFIMFHSEAECNRWAFLLLLEGQGKISDLERQIPIVLFAARPVEGGGFIQAKVGKLILDFRYKRDGKVVEEDTKGGETALSNWKHRHFKAQFGREILLTQ